MFFSFGSTQISSNKSLQLHRLFQYFWPLVEVKPDIDAVFALGCILLVLLFGAPEMEARKQKGKMGKHDDNGKLRVGDET